MSKVGMTDLVDDVHASVVNKRYKLSLKQIEVIKNCLLQASTFWLSDRIDIKFFYQTLSLLFADKYRGPHMIMILFYASVTTTSLFPHTAFTSTKSCNFFAVLTFRHFNLKIYIPITIFPTTSDEQKLEVSYTN